MNTSNLYSRVNQLTNSLVFKDEEISLRSYHTIYDFINQHSLESTSEKNSAMNPDNIPYHQSIFHFLLYYAHTPKIPFILIYDQQIMFASIHKKNVNTLEISFPEILKSVKTKKIIEHFLDDEHIQSFLQDLDISTILIRDAPNGIVQQLKTANTLGIYHLESIKEINYQIYNVKRTLQQKGKQFAKLRWHLNAFKKADHTIESVPLNKNKKAVIHLIGSWKKMAIEKRGFSFVNVRSDKLAAQLFDQSIQIGNKQQTTIPQVYDCLSRVLKVDGQIRSFQFGFPLGILRKQNVFAHAIGITDISIPHLAEYAQYDYWMHIHKQGYEYVNDGPSWKSSLELFKQKFRPIAKKRTYYLGLKQ